MDQNHPTPIKKSLYEQIGQANISEAITSFYLLAFSDPLIGHFFFHKDRAELTRKQITFASLMLGARNQRYEGLPLRQAHKGLPLTLTHFRRRQRLMEEVLAAMPIDTKLAKEWLALEEGLKGLIINSSKNCRD